MVAIALLLWLVPRAPSATLAYARIREPGSAGPTRGDSDHTAQIGDTLRLTASSKGTYQEFRIYREDQLELRCPGAPVCRGAEGADFKLLRSGTYKLVGMAASVPIPPPGGSLDIDLAAARRVDAKIDETHVTVD